MGWYQRRVHGVLIQRSLMHSVFDLLFETPSYRPVYVISDSEMKELKKNQNQEELDEITTQKVRLEDAFKAQLKHLEERKKEVKNELKVLSAKGKKKKLNKKSPKKKKKKKKKKKSTCVDTTA